MGWGHLGVVLSVVSMGGGAATDPEGIFPVHGYKMAGVPQILFQVCQVCFDLVHNLTEQCGAKFCSGRFVPWHTDDMVAIQDPMT